MSFVLNVLADHDPQNPRVEYENVTQMWCAHRRYTLGDPGFRNEAVTAERIRSQHGPIALIKPLYLYDHSGLTISTTPFSCPWDSGQIGWVWITREKLRTEYRRSKEYPTQAKWAEAILQGEVSTYDQYLTGDVWEYRIIEVETGAIVESCGGMFGHDYAEKEGNSMLQYVNEHAQQYQTRKAA